MDTVIGPTVDSHARAFDFTVLFEESILSLLPWSLFLLILPVRLKYLCGQPKKIKEGTLYLAKGTSWIVYVILQLSQLILWTRVTAFTTVSTIPAAVLAFVGSTGAATLSYFEHCHSKRPSTLLTLWMLFILLSDATRVRTMWLMGQQSAISILHTCMLPVLILVLILESCTKASFVDAKYAPRSREEAVSIFNRSVFWWLNPLFLFGRSHELLPDNLPPIDSKLLTARAAPRLYTRWKRRNPNSSSLLVTSLQAYSSTILTGAIWRLFMALFTISLPLLLNSTTRWFDSPRSPGSEALGYGLIGAYLVVFLGRAVSTALSEHQSYRLITMTRAGLVSMIYDKTLKMNLAEAEKSTPLTLMSTDIERIGQGLQFIHEIWATPVEFGVAIYLLEREVILGCLAPIMVVILSIVGTAMLGMRIDPHQKKWIEAIERRIASTTDMLRNMKSVKMSGLEDAVTANLQSMRVEEVDISQITKALFIGCQVFSTTTTTLSPILGFMIYVLMQKNKGEPGLAASNAFTSLSLFNILSSSVNIFITALPAIFSGISCFGRIQTFLLLDDNTVAPSLEDELSQVSLISAKGEPMTPVKRKMPPFNETNNTSEPILVIDNGTVQWQGQDEPLLSGINLSVRKGNFLLVTGPIGCGKTSLLYTILGEAPLVAGNLHLSTTSLAYCQQSPWLPDTSVRNCILGEMEWDKDFYQRVLFVCALSDDLQRLDGGDQALVGNGGANLSGGQRQRVALARAVYSRRDLFLLDDVLSALDANTSKHIGLHLFSQTGLFRELGSTVIYTGNSDVSNQYADSALSLGKAGQDYQLESLMNEAEKKITTVTQGQEPTKPEKLEQSSQPQSKLAIMSSQDTKSLRQHVPTFSVMIFYLKSLGIGFSCLAFALSLVYSFFLNFPSLWVNIWIQADTNHPYQDLGMYLGVYALCSVLALAANSAASCLVMIKMVKRSAEGLHAILLKTVAGAPMSYFESTDIGTITNHFSQDMEKVDIEIPLTGLQSLFAFTSALVQLIILAIGAKYIAIAFPIVILFIVAIQRVYLQTSRQLRLLDLEAKSPLYSHFTETLSGLATIRAFGLQAKSFDMNSERLDYSQGPFYLLYCAQRWLSLVLNLVVGAMAVLMMGIAFKLQGTASAGDIGLAFVNLITFSQSIQALVTWWTMMEASIGAVHRVETFERETMREDCREEMVLPPDSWPASGAIEIRGVTAFYRSSPSPVLRNVTLSIAHGQKIGICGRTGSGKTSLILSLLRLIDINEGSVLIDGLDISKLPAKILRQRLIAISQDPLSLKDTVRRNLDPQSIHSDEQLQDKLRRVKLWDIIDTKGGLGATMQDRVLSHGQRQLFCLARALLQSSPIVILDELTSSADEESQDLISQIITEDFHNRTILTIAHRLGQMSNYDQILVLDGGQVVEQGSPQDLLRHDDSVFRELYMQQHRQE